MNRPLLIRCDNHPYHIASRCHEQEFFPLPLQEIWNIFIFYLHQAHVKHHLGIHSFVLMGNHFHLLCHTPKANIDEVMHFLMRLTSMAISKRLREGQFRWEGRYRWSMISSRAHYFQVYRYVLQNPVRAGIVNRVEDYQFSTLRTKVPFPLHSFIPFSFGGEEGELIWLNEKYDEEDRELIRLGLRKGHFDVSKRRLKAFSKMSLPVAPGEES